jgi:hypothetical protein
MTHTDIDHRQRNSLAPKEHLAELIGLGLSQREAARAVGRPRPASGRQASRRPLSRSPQRATPLKREGPP